MFLKIGKTHVANNKIDTLYTLFEKLKNSSVSDILKHYYKTDDITWGYANGEWSPMSYTGEQEIDCQCC